MTRLGDEPLLEQASTPAKAFPKPEATDWLALFESAAAAEDGYARWTASVADKKTAEAQAPKAHELTAQGGKACQPSQVPLLPAPGGLTMP
jgi:hypothetical protein